VPSQIQSTIKLFEKFERSPRTAGLARTIHEDVLQTQQIGSCRCLEASGDDGDPERVVEVASFLKVPSGAERPAMPAGCAVWGACS